jgi:hypothetical protein
MNIEIKLRIINWFCIKTKLNLTSKFKRIKKKLPEDELSNY